MPHTALITCSQESEGLLALELRRLLPDCSLVWAADGLMRVECDLAMADLAAIISGKAGPGSIFARHIAPVQVVLPDDASVAQVCNAAMSVCGQIPAGARWNIHVRDSERRAAVESAAESAADPELRRRSDPQTIVSVIRADAYYVGMADAAHCLSTWPGGERRFRKEEARISRAEFKLLEALEVFDLRLPASGMAVDLGAAPGGWTRVLLEHGLDVTAVDPADLDRRLKGHPRLRHVRMTAERFREHAPACTVVVNDMRMSAEPSANLMASYAYRIEMSARRQGANDANAGLGIMTLKLPERGITSRAMLDLIDRCLDILMGAFGRVRARQLFHNRSEVTAVMEGLAQCV